MSNKSYRVVVCVDVDAPNLAVAYGLVYKAMSATGLEWESSDEWFDEDDNSDGGDPDELQAARMAYFRETEDDRCEHGLFFSGAGACPQCGGGAE
jgi:hypothetical protein